MATNEDNARLLVSIEANTRAFAKQMTTVAKQSADAAKYVEDNFKRANDNVSNGFQSGGKKVEQSLGAQRAAVSNLSFQLNDIAMGLASGTSPFTIMVQQGSQVSQALQGSGGLIGAVKTLGGAFATMLNPVSLVSFALIGLTGYAVQFFAEMVSSGEVSEETLKKQAELIQRVAATYGDQIPILKEYAAQLKKAADEAERLAGIKATKEGIAADLRKDFVALTEAQRDAISLVPDANREYTVLAGKMEAGSAEASDFQRVIDALNSVLANNTSPALSAARDALVSMQAASAEASGKIVDLDKAAGAMNLTMDQAKTIAVALTGQMTGLGTQGVGAVADIASAFSSQLLPKIGKAIEGVDDLIKKYTELQGEFTKNPLGQLSPVFSNNGEFLNSDGNPLVAPKGADPRWAVAGESAAAEMVKGFEGFITKAKWDVNAYRVGFGSDTVTRANGMIEKVTADTVVTLEDAQRDLERRLVEFQDGIVSAIGNDTWRSLNEAQKAALTSIAYNYGELPKRIVSAIQGGGGPEAVAQAIAALGSDNAGINKTRRKEEAQAYLSGSGLSLKDAGIGGRSPTDIFQGDIEQVQARIAALNAEYAAQAQLNPLVKDYGYAVAKARVEQQLLSEAQKAGVEITPQLREQIAGLAENYAKATSSSERLKESQQQAADAAKELSGMGKDFASGFISDLRNGASAADALKNALNRVLDKIIDISLQGLFGGGLLGGGGGLFGGSIIPGILHSGGTAGKDGYGHGRAFSPSTFAGAKRYHAGGIAGLQPGEIPAILQRGEVVLPRGAKMGGGGRMHVTVGVSSDGNGNLKPFVESVAQNEVGKSAPKIVDRSVSRANSTAPAAVGRYQAMKAGGDYRLT